MLRSAAIRAACASEILEPLLDCRPFYLELRDRPAGVALQRPFARNVAGERCIEPVELGDAARDRIAPSPRRRQLVRQFMPLLAKLFEFPAALRQRGIRALLGRLRFGNGGLDRRDLFVRSLCFGTGCLGRALRFDPTGVEQPRLDAANFGRQLPVSFGRASLPAQLRGALLLVTQDFGEPGKVGFRRAELLLSVFAPCVEPRNAGSLFQQKASLDRLGGNDRADLSWLTRAGECAPVAASAKSKDTSFARTSRPSIR